ncbi:MAG: hypothetical protein JWN43_553 [Gammaproteobacteria bacterium]|nr:hypothetical protein [Gammaproteobacteria bacterium]
MCAAAGVGAVADERNAESRLALASSRCTTLGELVSCYAAVSMKPNDPELLVAEADVLVRSRRPGEAIGVYRNALRTGAAQEVVNPKIAVAQSERRSFLDICETQTGEIAERACEAAWLPRAADEVTVFKRRGLLLQNDGDIPAALDAFLTAARLVPRDRSVARSVLSLSADMERKDASILMARSAAQMALGHPAEAVASLREALRLSPDLAEAKVRLRTAERSLPTQIASSVAHNPGRPESGASGESTRPYTNEAPATRSN